MAVHRAPMKKCVSKSRFKARALEYFREIEKTGTDLLITDRGTPVLKITPYAEDPEELLKPFRGTVLKYKDPTKPVSAKDWKVLK
jgi:antitoxin (DNA-binding transcriptional repressor) of toxin-antitoxin stability system